MTKIEIEWVDSINIITIDEIVDTENKLGVCFPKLYVDTVLFHDGCTPKKDSFQYYDEFSSRNTVSGVGAFIPIRLNEFNSVLKVACNAPEFFPTGLIAFAETGGGDFICFDYRNGKDNLDPPVVYWNHEANVGKDVSFVASNFAEFLSILKNPEDI